MYSTFIKNLHLNKLLVLSFSCLVITPQPAAAQNAEVLDLPDFNITAEELPVFDAPDAVTDTAAMPQDLIELPSVPNDEQQDDADNYDEPGSVSQPDEIVEMTTTTQPDAQQLSQPSPQIPTAPNPRAVVSQTSENLFYDAESLVPQSELSRGSVPRKVNPRYEPASTLVVVSKNHGASSRQAQMVAAQRAMKLGRYESAVDLYETLYTKNKKDPAILMGRAVSYQRLGQDDMAVQSYEELLEISPNDVDAKVNMLGIVGQNYPSVALRQLLELRDDNPQNIGVVAQIAGVYAQLENYTEAVRYLGVAASLEPQNASHLFNMAIIADRAGSRKDAVKYYEKALEVDTLYGKSVSIPRDTIFERLAQLR